MRSASTSHRKESTTKISKKLSKYVAKVHLKKSSKARSSIYPSYSSQHQITSQAGNPMSTASILNIDNHFAKTAEEPADENVLQKRSSIRERIFIALHKPTGFTSVYHLCLITVVLISCVVLNLLRPKIAVDDEYLSSHYNSIHLTMITIDSVLSELLIRLWSGEYLPRYCSLYGKLLYFWDNLYARLFDLLGLVTFVGYTVFHAIIRMNGSPNMHDSRLWLIDIILRFAHIIQVLQVYRVIHKLTKPFYRTLYQQANPLLMALLCMVMIILIGSISLYITEVTTSTHPGFHNMFEAVWLTFETFSTLGYADRLPYSFETMAVLCVIAVIGLWAFALPSYIIGNGLSIALLDQNRVTFKYLSIAELIRKTITQHHVTNRVQFKNEIKSERRLHARLLADHIQGIKGLNKIRNVDDIKMLKINYVDVSEVDDHDHSQADEVLWDKLLQVKKPKKLKGISTYNKSTAVHQTSGQPKEFQSFKGLPTVPLKTLKKAHSDRMLDHLGDMDLTRYSADNSLLWYNLDLIEDDIDEMSLLVQDKIRHRLGRIRSSCRVLFNLLSCPSNETSERLSLPKSTNSDAKKNNISGQSTSNRQK